MWLKIGSFADRDEAAEIVSELSDLGIRIELKPHIDWDLEEKYILRGKLSELEKYSYQEVREWKRYVEIVRSIVTETVSSEEFERKFLESADPETYSHARKLQDTNITDEEFFLAAESAFKLSLLLTSIYGFLKLNGVEVGDYIRGSIPEDPELVIELDEEVEGCEKIYVLSFVPVWDVYVDVVSLLTAERVDVDYSEVAAVLDAAARLVGNIITKIPEVRDLDELREYSSGVIDSSSSHLGGEVVVHGEEVFGELIRTLEKAGIVRVSGGRIWLRK